MNLNEILKIYLNTEEITKMYLGTLVIYSSSLEPLLSNNLKL